MIRISEGQNALPVESAVELSLTSHEGQDSLSEQSADTIAFLSRLVAALEKGGVISQEQIADILPGLAEVVDD